jgi:hypothetical protein
VNGSALDYLLQGTIDIVIWPVDNFKHLGQQRTFFDAIQPLFQIKITQTETFP